MSLVERDLAAVDGLCRPAASASAICVVVMVPKMRPRSPVRVAIVTSVPVEGVGLRLERGLLRLDLVRGLARLLGVALDGARRGGHGEAARDEEVLAVAVLDLDRVALGAERVVVLCQDDLHGGAGCPAAPASGAGRSG